MKDRTIIWIVIIGLLFWMVFIRPPAPIRRAMRAAVAFLKEQSPKETKHRRTRKTPQPPAQEESY